MASKTWRLRELSGASKSLALTRIQLLNGSTDVMAGAVITCTHTVDGDPLAALLDASGICSFDLTVAAQAGFAVTISLPTAVDADAISIEGDAVHGYCLEYLTDGIWMLASRKVQSVPVSMPSAFALWVSSPVIAASQVASLGIIGGGTFSARNVTGLVAFSVVSNPVMLRISPIWMRCGVTAAEVHFMIASDTLNRCHFGLWFYDLSNPTYGYRVATLDGNVTLSYFPGALGTVETEQQEMPMPAGALALNVRHALRAEIGADKRVTVYVNGTLVGTFPNPMVSDSGARAAGVFSYTGNYELYQIDICTPDSYTPNSCVRILSTSALSSDTSLLAQGLQSISSYRTSKLIDIECGGQGRIYGTVSRKGTPSNIPLRRRVRLHRSVDGYLARETWSKADGSYEFREISTRYEWDVIAWDHELQEYSTVANNQLAEVA